MSWDLRCGLWQQALADVERVDAVIVDPPYGARTHGKQLHGRRNTRGALDFVSSRGIHYAALQPGDVYEFVRHWSPRTTGWICAFTDSELYPAWRDALRECGRYVFAPIPCVQIGMNVRLGGDGPSNWTTWLVVARPRSLHKWGTLPGAYVGNPFDSGENSARGFRRGTVVGGKPLWLMRAIVSDYTRPGDLICDPCAGGGTTLLAALALKRRGLGSERDPRTYELAQARLEERLGALPMDELLSLAGLSTASANDNGGPDAA